MTNFRKLIIFIYPILLFSAGCSKVEFSSSNNTTSKFEQNEYICDDKKFDLQKRQHSQSVDILFITDTSSSFNSERAAVAQNIGSLVNQLPASMDFQIAVMLAHGGVSAYSGKLYQAKSEPRVINSTLHSPNEIQNYLSQKLTKVREDNSTDGGEAGLYSLTKALKPNQINSIRDEYNFFRTDAGLIIIFVSDENDICAIYPEGVTPVVDTENAEGPANQQYCGNINQYTVSERLREIQQDRALMVSGILYTQLDYPQAGENEIGYGYLDVINLNGGLTMEMNSNDYSAGLASIGELATGRIEYILDYKLPEMTIEPESIVVQMGGAILTHTYSPQNNEIHLHEISPSGNAFNVYYCYSDPNYQEPPASQN